MIPPEEQRHLDRGPEADERPGGVGTVSVVAKCRGDAGVVVERGRQVLRSLLANEGPLWPSVDEWRQIIPAWFVEACAPEQSREEVEGWLRWWRSLPPEEQAQASRERRWTLADWLYWMDPSERQWFWWDAAVEDPDTLRVVVEVSGWPAPLGALEWLLRTSGAVEVVHEQPARA
jgi:hypothetical protein